MGETDTAAAKPGIPAARADQKSASPKSSIEQLSVQLLEQTEKNSILENEMLKLKRYNEELLRRIHESRKQQEDSDREVQKLSTEVEELSATLFDQANNKVKEANVQANDFKVRNGKLIESLKQKDMVIDVLKKELTQLKDMLTHLSSNQPNGNGDASSSLSEADKSLGNSVEDNSLGDASFTAASLQKFNGQLIYSPLYNQLRFDLQSFNQFRRALASTTKPFSIRDSSFFRTILAEDVEPVLRLDLSPAVKFYRRRSFIISLMDSKVTIEPLSAYTEVWKSNNLSQAALPAEKSAFSSNKGLEQGVKPDPKLFRYDTDRPVAVEEKCSLCGEKRKEMNFARLYRLKIKDYAYTICISCANKLRCTVELLGYLKSLKQSVSMDEVASLWCKLTELRAKLYFTKFGLWCEADKFGLVYGWKNQWWNQEESQQFSGNMSEIPASSAASIFGNDTTNESVNEEKYEKNEKNEDNEKDGKNEKYENNEKSEKSEKNKISGQQLENEAEKDLLSEEADTTISESKQNPVLEAKANEIAESSIYESKTDKGSKENLHNNGEMVEDSTNVKENVVVEDKAKAEEKSENDGDNTMDNAMDNAANNGTPDAGASIDASADFGNSLPSLSKTQPAVPESDFSHTAGVPRCRRCRAYVNPAMQQTGYQMICNLCGFTSPVPSDYTASVDSAGVRSDFYQRPELHAGVYELRVPREYAAASASADASADTDAAQRALWHVFVVDTSSTAVDSGFTGAACTAIEMSLYGRRGRSLPQGAKVAILGFDSRLKFFDLSPGLREAKVAVVADVAEPFVPFAGKVFGSPVESQDIISASLERLQCEPAACERTALGGALKAADLLLAPRGGGLVTVLLGSVPTLAPGALPPKLPPHQGLRGMAAAEYARDVLTAGCAFYTDTLEKLYVDHCVGVNFFVGAPSPIDLANLDHLSARTGGATRLWPRFAAERDELDLANAVQRTVRGAAGYQAQIRIRCSRGLQVDRIFMCGRAYPGNDGICASIPVLGPDTSIACSFTHDGKLDTKKDAHFQVAVLYTDSAGVRRVRIINSIVSVTERAADVFSFANADAILALLVRATLSKFPADTSLVSVRNLLVAGVVRAVSRYAALVGARISAPGELLLPRGLATLPMHVLGVLKSCALMSRDSVAPDRRVDSFSLLANSPAPLLSVLTYPLLFALHSLQPSHCRWRTLGSPTMCSFCLPPATNLSQAQLQAAGAYLAFDGCHMYLWLHTQVPVQFLHDLFGTSIDSVEALDPLIVQLPILDTLLSRQVRALCSFLSMHYLGLATHSVQICRFKTDPCEADFLQLMYEDRSAEMVWSYADFLRYLHTRVQQLHIESPKPAGKRFGIF